MVYGEVIVIIVWAFFRTAKLMVSELLNVMSTIHWLRWPSDQPRIKSQQVGQTRDREQTTYLFPSSKMVAILHIVFDRLVTFSFGDTSTLSR
jgi:hypothetical protein